MNAHTAKKCFEENIALFANAQTQPEKFNLYNGLYNLADEIEKINHQIYQIGSVLNDIANVLRNR